MTETKADLSPEEKLLVAIFGEGKGSYPPRNEVDGVTLKDAISSILLELTERQRLVIHLRFGLKGPAQTLVEAGNALDVTRERIRQIETKALRWLRHPARARRLKPYLVKLEK